LARLYECAENGKEHELVYARQLKDQFKASVHVK